MKTITVRNLVLGEGLPKIIVPIMGKDAPTLLEAIANLEGNACDLVEWRIDHLENALDEAEVLDTLAQIRAALGDMPLLATFRTADEGGKAAISYEQYTQQLRAVAQSGNADLVDVQFFINPDVSALVKDLQSDGVYVIGSWHNWNMTPAQAEIETLLAQMRDGGCDIAKVAVMPSCPEDVFALMAATAAQSHMEDAVPLITMCMSQYGSITRVCGGTTGSCATFGCVSKSSAPGQIDANTMRTILNVLYGNSKASL